MAPQVALALAVRRRVQAGRRSTTPRVASAPAVRRRVQAGRRVEVLRVEEPVAAESQQRSCQPPRLAIPPDRIPAPAAVVVVVAEAVARLEEAAFRTPAAPLG